MRGPWRTLLVALIAVSGFTLSALANPSIGLDPLEILDSSCLDCHGKSKKSGLDMRSRLGLLQGGRRGAAIIPGEADKSLLYRVATHEVEDLIMPPDGPPLDPSDLEIIKAWINQGAHWPGEESSDEIPLTTWWSFNPPQRPPIPEVSGDEVIHNPIDHFVIRKRKEQGLPAAGPADRRTLIRRVYMDLLGLPPEPEKVESFIQDNSPDAYENLIDELLASPHYGERWARHWLDVVRYAESSGYETDHFYPYAWRYRDYVIKSLNDDKPYDRFIQEQIAADELWPNDMALEDSTRVHPVKFERLEARIGTGLYTIGPEIAESTQIYDLLLYERLTDRVDVTGAAFMGMTISCARCHDHKFDPVTQKDYFSLQAVFAESEQGWTTIQDAGGTFGYQMGFPSIVVVAEARDAYRRFEERVEQRKEKEKREKTAEKIFQIVSEVHSAHGKSPQEWSEQQKKLSDLVALWDRLANAEHHQEKVEEIKQAFLKRLKEAHDTAPEERTAEESKLAAPIDEAASTISVVNMTEVETAEHHEHYASIAKAVLEVKDNDSYGLYQFQFAQVLKHRDWDLTPPIHVLHRGELSDRRQRVGPGFPEVLASKDNAELSQIPDDGRPRYSRRKLALWLTNPDHPLTSRVIVNRLWQWHFGNGIVETANDFGRKGAPPSHPELLDWLATELIDRGWSLKAMHRLIMLSQTYRQASRYSDESALAKDPKNRFLWRMNRRRLEGEAIWDTVLSVAGTINLQMFGPPVVPPIAAEEQAQLHEWRPYSLDPKQHTRRAIYVMSRRNAKHPLFDVFDSPPTAESCPGRTVTTVSLQALWLLNNRTSFKQAQAFAARLVKQTESQDSAEWVKEAWKLALNRPPTEQEQTEAVALIERLAAQHQQPEKVATIVPDELCQLPVEKAMALSKFCLTMFNLGEFIYVD